MASPQLSTDVKFQIQILSSSERHEAISLWEEVENSCLRVPLAVSLTWTETWLRHYGDLIPHRFLVVKRDEQPCGIVLVCEGVDQFDGPFKLNTLHLGTAGEPEADSIVVEYNSILAEESLQVAVLHQIVNYLHAEKKWQELRLDGFRTELLTALLDQSFSCEIHQRKVPSYFHDLKKVRETGDELLQEFGKSTRKNLKRNLNGVTNLRTEWAVTLAQAEEIFESLVQLHQARWNSIGKPGVYASERFLNFHRDLLARLWERRQVALFRAHEGGSVLGCVQLWIDDNNVYEYQSGNLGNAGKLSPGLLVDYLCMQQAMSYGFDAFDFLGGDTRHKQSLSSSQNELTWLTFHRPKLKTQLLHFGRNMKLRAKQFLQRTNQTHAEERR